MKSSCVIESEKMRTNVVLDDMLDDMLDAQYTIRMLSKRENA